MCANIIKIIKVKVTNIKQLKNGNDLSGYVKKQLKFIKHLAFLISFIKLFQN